MNGWKIKEYLRNNWRIKNKIIVKLKSYDKTYYCRLIIHSSYRLMVRTLLFHSRDTGSNPVKNNKKNSKKKWKYVLILFLLLVQFNTFLC
jgi:hypothetical protein